jgi:xanthine dehydrogenase accessory factor
MSILSEAVELEKKGISAALCTIIQSTGSTPRHAGSKMIVFPDGRISGSVGGGLIENQVIEEALASIKEGKSRKTSYDLVDPSRGDVGVCGGHVDVYIEPIMSKPLLVVIGGGHVGKAVLHLAKWLGFRTAVSDDRVEFCTPEANPDSDLFFPIPMEQLVDHLEIDQNTYFVLTTRGYDVDIIGLPSILEKKPVFIGLIGSKRRWLVTKKGLLEKGLTEEVVATIHSPLGLELNAETPEEIAVSIIAEVIMARNLGTGKSMKYE